MNETNKSRNIHLESNTIGKAVSCNDSPPRARFLKIKLSSETWLFLVCIEESNFTNRLIADPSVGILLRGFLSLAIITSVLQLCIRRRRYYAIKYGNEYG